MNLVIVESPTKARTIQRFLSADFAVRSSYGHIRDLPKKELGVDVQNNFAPRYVIPLLARKRLNEIKKVLPKSQKIILATDEDREGEAIAWHLVKALGLDEVKNQPRIKYEAKIKNIERIVFHEITKQAIEDALKNPRDIDMDLVDAQQARRILDRLVGYELSPFLWRKVAKGLSAGRVQSVAVRLIVEREREIQNFQPQEYWTIEALLKKSGALAVIAAPRQNLAGGCNDAFTASLVKKDGQTIGKLDIKTKEAADKILKDLDGAQYQVADVEKKETFKNPLPPFTTSTLQQEAVKKLRFPAKLTMSLAQGLYEQGHITYHRTDSLSLSALAKEAAKKFILENFGPSYWPGFSRNWKTKTKGAQEAHEAIRPTYPENTPEILKTKLEKNQAELYNLIWSRFMASQMSSAIFNSATVNIEAKNYTFRAHGSVMKFDGFLKVYPIKFKETELPLLEKEEILELIQLMPAQHFTQPPPRYSEAALIKTLEENGIGRPSTYAPIISTVQERNYVTKNEQRQFIPTEIGFTVNDLLVQHFPEIVDLKFTARMEEDLDEIADGKKLWAPVVKEFYDPFKAHLNQKYEEVEKQKPPAEPTDKICPQCQNPLVIRVSRFGKFYACSNFPKCRYTESLNNSINVNCPKCFEGEIIEKRTKKGKIFYACSRWPECDFALWHKPVAEKCPQCGSLLVEVKNGLACSQKECDYKIKQLIAKK